MSARRADLPIRSRQRVKIQGVRVIVSIGVEGR